MLNINTNIMQLEAKDVFGGYEVNKGNYKKYKATLDFSLEAIKINELSKKKNEFYIVNNKQYNDSIISITFNYSVKDDNGKTVFKINDLRNKLYEKGFDITFSTDKKTTKIHYIRFKRSSGSSRVGKCLFIRKDLYKDIMLWSYMGICHDFGIPINLAALEAYISLTTSSIIDTLTGIKKENILVINEHFSEFKTEAMATEIIKEKYIDKQGNEKERDRLSTSRKPVDISNNIWDGQALLDVSYFEEKYADKGMLLLRNRFFKGACFNTNIQQFFKDAGITKIEELNGFTMAKDITDIKMICTKSCIKYTKFGTLETWLNLLEDVWGIVKHEKPTHHLLGHCVNTHYQLLNTICFSREETVQFLQPTMDYLDKILNNNAVMRNHLKLKINDDEIDEINSTNDFIMTIMQLNDKFSKTQMYADFRNDIKESFVANIRKGHVLISGNYSILFGNGLEMLKATIKDENNPMYFTGKSVLNVGEIHSTNFKYNTELLGCRSPHVTMGNLLVAKNVECKVLDTYFNLSRQIVCINSINENTLERLSSADFDSDQMLITNNEQIIKKVKDNYNKFLVPTSMVKAKDGVERKNTAKDKADLDIKTSVNKIGEIINLSQILNTYLWDKVNNGAKIGDKEIQDLYKDICQLDVMSCLEIDMAKKEFSVSNVLELRELRKKYKVIHIYDANGVKVKDEDKIDTYLEYLEILPFRTDERQAFAKENNIIGYTHKTVKPNFMKYTGNKKNKKKKDILKESNKKTDFVAYKSTMCLLENIVNKEFSKIKAEKTTDMTTFTNIFQEEIKILTSKCNKDRVRNILNLVKTYKTESNAIWSKDIPAAITSEEEIKEIKKKKYKDALEKKNECIEKISKLKVKAEDIKRIIKDLDIQTQEVIKNRNEKKKADGKKVDETKPHEIFGMGRFLLSILFAAHKEEFLKLFKEQKEPVEYLRLRRKNEDVSNEEIIKLYDLEFLVEKNS